MIGDRSNKKNVLYIFYLHTKKKTKAKNNIERFICIRLVGT